MIFDTNQEAGAQAQESAVEGEQEHEEVVTIKKSDYEKLNQTLGSLKRENKDLKKPKDPGETTEKTNDPDQSALLQAKVEKMALRTAGITHPDDVDLARKTAKKWNMDIDEVIDDEDFKVKLEKQQGTRANADATSHVKGDQGTSVQAKHTAEYWIAKGTPPTADQVPDRKLRGKIARAMMASAKNGGKTFYSD